MFAPPTTVLWKWSKKLGLTGDAGDERVKQHTLWVRIGRERASPFLLFYVIVCGKDLGMYRITHPFPNIQTLSIRLSSQLWELTMVNILTMAGFISSFICASICHAQNCLWAGSWDVAGLVEQSDQSDAGREHAHLLINQKLKTTQCLEKQLIFLANLTCNEVKWPDYRLNPGIALG